MAQRDRTQGFGFVYVDIASILKRDFFKDDFSQPISTDNVKTINIPKKEAKPAASQTDAPRERSSAIVQIRENLDRLQSLHHKLHAMLEELNHISYRKKE